MIKIKRQFTAAYRKIGGNYIGWIEEIPGANTQAKTLKELKENLREAALLIVEANRVLADSQSSKKITREPIAVSF